MKILNVILASLGSIIVLFILTKISGNKQMSHMSMFDYINGITIGSIAAEMATALEGDFLLPLIAMIIYAAASIIISYVSTKSVKLRRFLAGRSVVLMDKSKIYKQNFSKAKLDINEFLTQCRIKGFFNLSDIETAVIEPNGMISILPVSDKRTVNPNDLNLDVIQERPDVALILDGKLMEKNLQYTGNDKQWLEKKLKEQNAPKISDIFLATCDGENNLTVFSKRVEKPENDIFQ